MLTVETLRHIPLFLTLSQEQLQTLLNHGRLRKFGKRVAVFYKDDPGDAFYAICSGSVKVHALRRDSGEEVIYNILSAGDFFGELSLLDGMERSADVTTLEESALFIIRREDFLTCLRSAPDIAIQILQATGARLRQVSERLQTFAAYDAFGRVLKALTDLTARQGEVDLPLTQSDLAGLAGTTRETVNKALSHYRRKRFISTAGGKIVILKPEEIAEELERRFG